jgi:hypothetical protein
MAGWVYGRVDVFDVFEAFQPPASHPRAFESVKLQRKMNLIVKHLIVLCISMR